MSTQMELPPGWRIEDFSLTMPQFAANPSYFYRRLQAESPVHRITGTRMWILTRYADCNAVLTDTKRFLASGRVTGQSSAPEGYERLTRLGRDMLSANPPDHSRLRSLVSKAFTPRTVENLRSHILQIAGDLLDQVRGKGEMDLMRDFAFHLPAIVIAQMLGVPVADREQFKVWSYHVIQAMGADATPERRQAGMDAQLALAHYFDGLIAQRRAQPADDMISGLLRAEEQGDQLSEDEVVSTCILLLLAGHETTTNLIGSGLLTLLEHPDQFELLRRRPELAGTAVEEMMRFNSPVQRTGRRTVEEVVVGGVPIPAEQNVVTVLAAANRDAAIFPDPDRFDITRSPNPHIGFGKGIHYCLGAPLARLEAEIAFPLLLERLPGLKLAGDPVWNPASLIRGLHSLPLTFRA